MNDEEFLKRFIFIIGTEYIKKDTLVGIILTFIENSDNNGKKTLIDAIRKEQCKK